MGPLLSSLVLAMFLPQAVWYATDSQVARLCGDDARDYLYLVVSGFHLCCNLMRVLRPTQTHVDCRSQKPFSLEVEDGLARKAHASSEAL